PAVVTLAAGILMTPVWVGGLGAMALSAKYRQNASLLEVAVLSGAIVAVVGGVLGFAGLFRVLRSLLSNAEELPHASRTRAFVLIGAATMVYLGAVHFWRNPVALLLLGVLPLL